MPTDEPIYDFHRTKEALGRRGINVEYTGGYTIVRPADVVFENGIGNVEFQNDKGESGIFIIDKNGHYRQVFMYKRDYHLYRYGSPRYHICRCDTIRSFITSGGFREHYRYANTDEVTVLNMDNGYREETVNDLELCGYCANMLGNEYGMPLESFVEILKEAGEANPDEEAKEVDIFGYVRNWEMISDAKRELANYTCEVCGYQAEDIFDRRFIHVHHRDGDKLNNRMENLQCLCIHCHANVDPSHARNFSRGAQADMLREFEEKMRLQ